MAEIGRHLHHVIQRPHSYIIVPSGIGISMTRRAYLQRQANLDEKALSRVPCCVYYELRDLRLEISVLFQ